MRSETSVTEVSPLGGFVIQTEWSNILKRLRHCPGSSLGMGQSGHPCWAKYCRRAVCDLTVMNNPSAAQRPYASFLQGGDGHLGVNWWDGTAHGPEGAKRAIHAG